MHRVRLLHYRCPFDVPKFSPQTLRVYKCTCMSIACPSAFSWRV